MNKKYSRCAAGMVLILALALPTAHSQPSAGFTFFDNLYFNSNLLFPPLIASHLEPRAGFILHGDGNAVRGDIGSSIDVVRIRLDTTAASATMSVGGDLFTWTSLRRLKNYFPVDAIDYFFGINVGYVRPINDKLALESRFRLSHISAHLADGRYDKGAGHWVDYQLARIYSREFFELIVALEWANTFRVYAGGQYIYHVRPAEIRKFLFQAGLEGVAADLAGNWLHAYAAYDIKVYGAPAYVASHSIQAGLKFGRWRGRGVNLFVAWYDGMNQSGEFYDQRQSFWGPGLTIEF